MSTFDGLVAEFPAVRVDYFRSRLHHPPPLACFLSHVHSDHLQGLESLKAPFVYCSPATREILLRLEKYPHRMNFAKGILETRIQTYKHLKYLLKTIPLETPTVIELEPGNEIQVTLFDANHCVGAVMFLIQGQGKAILYTGDVRAETWWVNSIVQNPILAPYSSGLRFLDKIYLDTTFANRSALNREFPSKAEGLRELLTKVSEYPPDTVFHFEAWTFGYENVWIALSAWLESPIHLDKYRWGLFRSLMTTGDLPVCPEAPPLVGFNLGNHRKHGCLTPDSNVRIHSCERGTQCPTIKDNVKVVQIIPIVKRLRNGTELAEVGAGGGKGDLDQVHELEADPGAISQLAKLCASKLEDPETLAKILAKLERAINDDARGRIRLCSSRAMRDDGGNDRFDALDEMPLRQFVDVMARLAEPDTPASPPAERGDNKTQDVSASPAAATATATTPTTNTAPLAAAAAAATAETGGTKPPPPPPQQQLPLPRVITFPYARHASYAELCELVQAFHPRDIYPCTLDEAGWTPNVGMRALFGHLCSADVFEHDRRMMEAYERRGKKRKYQGSQETQASNDAGQTTDATMSSPPPPPQQQQIDEPLTSFEELGGGVQAVPAIPDEQSSASQDLLDASSPVLPTALPPASSSVFQNERRDDEVPESRPSTPTIREWAEMAAKNTQGMDWANFGGLICTGNGHTEEVEL